MGQRLELHELFEQILGSDHVYFQPPENVQMLYPAIVYQRQDIDKKSADNIAYSTVKQYQVTLIDPNPDSEFVDKISDLSRCTYDRFFVADNLNHDVFTLYF